MVCLGKWLLPENLDHKIVDIRVKLHTKEAYKAEVSLGSPSMEQNVTFKAC